MSSHVKISSPFIKNFEHANYTTSTAITKFVDKADAYKRRVSVIIQNQSANGIYFNSDGGATGILIAAGFTLSFDNYNGAIWLKGTSGGENVHVAIAEA
jgi:hypothetical protein